MGRVQTRKRQRRKKNAETAICGVYIVFRAYIYFLFLLISLDSCIYIVYTYAMSESTKTLFPFRLDPGVVEKIDALVEAGFYDNRTEAVEHGLALIMARAVWPSYADWYFETKLRKVAKSTTEEFIDKIAGK